MFRFTIRDLLWLTVVVAILVAFWATSYREANNARESERQAVEAAKRAEQQARQ
jgi:Tfp pilus assembly protein PilE